MKSEQELVFALKEGDEKAFEQIFNEHFDRLCLYRFAQVLLTYT
jgi:hypothetical protein